MRKLESAEASDLMSAVTRRGEVVVEGHPVGHVEGFDFVPDPDSVGDARRLVLRAARRALVSEMPIRVARLEAAADTAFAWLPSQRIAWEGAPVARLRRGASVIRPAVEITLSEFLDGPQRERVRLRLQRFLDQHIHDALTPLFLAAAMAEREGALRGPLHRLIEGLGVVPGATEEDVAPALRAKLKALDVRAGRFSLFLPALLKPRARQVRAALWALQHNLPVPDLPPPGQVSLPPPAWPNGFAAAIGWVEAGPVLVRLDIAERIAAELAFAARGKPIPVPADLAPRLSVRAEVLPAVLHALGFRVNPAVALREDECGPPAPPTLSPVRKPLRRPAVQDVAAPVREGPFAALANLRR
jgi:ATP-dependent RNA helicase SUPV3L1/SUV3